VPAPAPPPEQQHPFPVAVSEGLAPPEDVPPPPGPHPPVTDALVYIAPASVIQDPDALPPQDQPNSSLSPPPAPRASARQPTRPAAQRPGAHCRSLLPQVVRAPLVDWPLKTSTKCLAFRGEQALDGRMTNCPRSPLLIAVLLLASIPTLLLSQNYKVVKKLPPAAAMDHSFAILDAVVTEQWPATLPLVNAPTDMELLNPGQCIRGAALANGEGQEHYFDHASLSWTVRVAGKDVDLASSPANLIKQIKLEGADRVLAALQAGAIKGPIQAWPRERWPHLATNGAFRREPRTRRSRSASP